MNGEWDEAPCRSESLRQLTSLLSQNSWSFARKHTQNSTLFDDGGRFSLKEKVSKMTYDPLPPPIWKPFGAIRNEREAFSPAAYRWVSAESVLGGLPLVPRQSHDDLLLEAEILHFNRADEHGLVLLDDRVLERHVLHVQLLPEVDVVRGRLPEGDRPLLRYLGADEALCYVGQELDAPERRHARRLSHDAHLSQRSSLVIGENDLLLCSANPIKQWMPNVINRSAGSYFSSFSESLRTGIAAVSSFKEFFMTRHGRFGTVAVFRANCIFWRVCIGVKLCDRHSERGGSKYLQRSPYYG